MCDTGTACFPLFLYWGYKVIPNHLLRRYLPPNSFKISKLTVLETSTSSSDDLNLRNIDGFRDVLYGIASFIDSQPPSYFFKKLMKLWTFTSTLTDPSGRTKLD